MEVSIPERDSEIEADDLRKIRDCPPNVSDMVHGVARMNPGCWVVGCRRRVLVESKLEEWTKIFSGCRNPWERALLAVLAPAFSASAPHQTCTNRAWAQIQALSLADF